jgi:hypothetical protein
MRKLLATGLAVLAAAAAAGVASVGPSPSAGPPDRTVVFVRSQ